MEAWIKVLTPIPGFWMKKGDPRSEAPVATPRRSACAPCSTASSRWCADYSTVTVFARLRGWSTFRPRSRAIR